MGAVQGWCGRFADVNQAAKNLASARRPRTMAQSGAWRWI